MSEAKVRYANPEDAEAIYRTAAEDPAFRVSNAIRFYELSELKEWATDRRNNLLALLERDGRIIGFFFCKVMSPHWAMLDNFYLTPSKRGAGHAKILFDFLRNALRERGVDYLTCLVRGDHAALLRFVRRIGFRERDKYTWCDMFLTG